MCLCWYMNTLNLSAGKFIYQHTHLKSWEFRWLQTNICVRKHIYVYVYIHRNMYESIYSWCHCSVSLTHMGWLRLVGSIKLQVSFAKEPFKRDCILQKSPMIWSIVLTVATPYLPADSHLNWVECLYIRMCILKFRKTLTVWMYRMIQKDTHCVLLNHADWSI